MPRQLVIMAINTIRLMFQCVAQVIESESEIIYSVDLQESNLGYLQTMAWFCNCAVNDRAKAMKFFVKINYYLSFSIFAIDLITVRDYGDYDCVIDGIKTCYHDGYDFWLHYKFRVKWAHLFCLLSNTFNTVKHHMCSKMCFSGSS